MMSVVYGDEELSYLFLRLNRVGNTNMPLYPGLENRGTHSLEEMMSPDMR